MVCAVIAPHSLTAAGEPEVFIAITPADHQQVGFGLDDGGGPAPRGVSLLQPGRALTSQGGITCRGKDRQEVNQSSPSSRPVIPNCRDVQKQQ